MPSARRNDDWEPGGIMTGSKAVRVRRSTAAVVVAVAVVGLGALAAPGAAAAIAKDDPGINSAEALQNPQCDSTVKRIRIQTYAAPLCVKAWKDGDDNGGATAQGVDKDSIKIVVLWNNLNPEQAGSRQGLYTNQATGENDLDGSVNAIVDQNEIYKL